MAGNTEFLMSGQSQCNDCELSCVARPTHFLDFLKIDLTRIGCSAQSLPTKY